MSKRTSEDWLNTLASAGIPCGPINSIAEVFDDPQLQHRGMQITMEHATGTGVGMPGSPLKFSESPVQYQRPPPTLGEHTEEVLLDVLQLSHQELEELRTQRVV
jgi:crotonobetainyl-CoA:carnitine CoA-transferase CaiB-like acyl-CoA transferase